MPIGTVGNPFYGDSTNPTNPPETQTNQVLAKLSEIQKSSSVSGFNGEFNLTTNQQVRDLGREQFFLWQSVYFYLRKDEIKRI